jgi:hypothetical protein
MYEEIAPIYVVHTAYDSANMRSGGLTFQIQQHLAVRPEPRRPASSHRRRQLHQRQLVTRL